MGIAVRHQFHRFLGGGIERHRLVGAIGLRKRDLLVGAVDRGRRSEHQVLRAEFPRQFQDVPRADEVGIDIGLGIFKAVSDAGLGREVDDDLGLGNLRRMVERRPILKHADDRLEAVRTRQDLMPALLQRHVVIGSHAVEADHEMSFVDQSLGEMKADEARGAGDEVAHDHVPRLCCQGVLTKKAGQWKVETITPTVGPAPVAGRRGPTSRAPHIG